MSNFSTYIREKICQKADEKCKEAAILLANAVYLDIDYDAISQTFTLSAFFDEPFRPHVAAWSPRRWDFHIGDFGGLVKTEVGVLNNERSTQSEELSLSGFLIAIGEETKPSESTNPLDALTKH